MASDIKPNVPETVPGVATAEQGAVILDGPDGVAVSMTAEAAFETARRLTAAAHEAERQTNAEPEPLA